MPLIPIDDDDIPAGRALRTEFARFWSTEKGEPRAIYDRFTAATPVAEGVAVEHVTTDPVPVSGCGPPTQRRTEPCCSCTAAATASAPHRHIQVS